MLKLGDRTQEACEKLPNLCKFLNGLELREVPDYTQIGVLLFGERSPQPLEPIHPAQRICIIVDALGKRIVEVLGTDSDARATGHFSDARLKLVWSVFRELRLTLERIAGAFLKPEVLELARAAYSELTEHMERVSIFSQKS